jgi:hypothetical protein
MRRSPPWLSWLVVAAVVWAQCGLGFSLVRDRTPHGLTLVVAIEASGAYTLLLWLSRRLWLHRLARRPVAWATALGIFNAAVVEALFLGVQTAFGADGVAANANLLLDWLITMPWYAGMVWIFVRVQHRQRYSAAAVLLWGAAYETGADGLVGGLLGPAAMGTPPNVAQHLAFLFGLAVWQFIPVYSSMVLAPAWVLDEAHAMRVEPVVGERARLLPGLKPLVWLACYAAYLIGVLVVIGITSAR